MLIRPRRNRKNPIIRSMLQETSLDIKDLIAPFFVIDGKDKIEPIEKMPGIFRYTIDTLIEEIEHVHRKGIQTIALFPALDQTKKSHLANEAYNPEGLIPRAIRAIKKALPSICLIADIALDPFTEHGHDGIISQNQEILNDETVDILIRQALTFAEAGVDIVAPSDMMDGRIRKIRIALDNAGFINTSILAYTAKYASALYAPFRDAVKVNLAFGDKKTYQLNPANIREALLETKLDQEEGADMLLVKPATLYLDVLSKMKENAHIPVGAYHVSGEYAMVIAAASQGIIDPHQIFYESLLSIKRAGASFIFTYAYRHMFDFFGH
ncbi:MAG: porphobilinogen synthase [Simkaniaceae bacterium]|nr:porphobilinogen synthase [Simkaniaceae bacterium]MCF7852148.1 porphobilinogen synthase [Simkaniaceae bacterium]